MFDANEAMACRRLIEAALEEDLGTVGDITSIATIPASLTGRAIFVARSRGVLAGIQAAEMVCRAVDPALEFQALRDDGQVIRAGDALARVRGTMRAILAVERTALNFLQHLSGIATLTRRYVEALPDRATEILDTRKTLPGWRALAKYAVRCGGGHNHRTGLYDAILIKDNHLAALSHAVNPIGEALAAARAAHPAGILVEIEVESLDQLERALTANPDRILLDNMTLDQLRDAVRCRNQRAPGIRLEASGGVRLETVRAIAETGVDCISVGALTHSAPALDVALDYEM
jgi:nicotinate-nucleotide pyrophosphorylase (carboxylating)